MNMSQNTQQQQQQQSVVGHAFTVIESDEAAKPAALTLDSKHDTADVVPLKPE